MTASPLVLLPLGPEEERTLLRRLREGRREAFEALYHRFVGRTFRLAASLLGDRMAAEDATQEVFLRVYRSIQGFRGDAGLGTWIHRIAVNVCYSELTRRRRRPAELSGADPSPAVEGATDAGVGDLHAVLDLAALLSGLEPLKRVTFYLHHVEGLHAAEIANLLDDTRDAVLKRLQRTRSELLERMRMIGVTTDAEQRGRREAG